MSPRRPSLPDSPSVRSEQDAKTWLDLNLPPLDHAHAAIDELGEENFVAALRELGYTVEEP